MLVLTGATGFLGQHLISALAASGQTFTCLVRRNSPHRNHFQSAPFRILDFEALEELTQALAGCDTLIHAAGLINGTDEDLWKTNVELTDRLVRAAKDSWVKRIIFVSSAAAVHRHGEYGKTKYEAEKIVQASGIPSVILRPAFIYGTGDRQNTGLMIQTLKKSPLIPLLGGGSFQLQPVYVGDVVSLILEVLKKDDICGEFNVAGPAQISLKEILQLLAASLELRRLFVPIPLKPVQKIMRFYLRLFPKTRLPAKQILELDKHAAFDISKTTNTFGFQPVTFGEGLKKMMSEPCAG